MKRVIHASSAEAAANILREEILSRNEDNWWLGSEEELVARLGISRPTFRQAARILEHEHLLVIRRGPGGGYFARMPDPEVFNHMGSILLRSRNTTVLDMMTFSAPIGREAARLAAQSNNETQRAELRQLLDDFLQETPPYDSRTFTLQESRLGRLTASLSGNFPIELAMNMINDFGLSQTHIHVFGEERRMEEWRNLQLRLGQAILDRDPDVAELTSRRRQERMTEWFKQDLEAGTRDSYRQRLLYPTRS